MPSRHASGRVACVVGGLEVVRALGAAGIGSRVVDEPGGTVAASRYVVADVRDDGRPLPELLADLAPGGTAPIPLLYDNDDALLAISRARDALAPLYRFPLPPADLVEALVDKGRFQALAERLGLDVPRAARVRPAACAPGDIGLPFPMILKAIPFRDASWRRIGEQAKVLLVGDAEELGRLWPRLADADLELLAQEVVPGSERDVVSYHVYVDAAGSVAGEFTGEKIRTFPTEHGMSSALVTTDDDEVRRAGRDAVERLGLLGPAKLDFKRGPDGRLHLLEVNPRFTLWSQPGAVAGVNLPALAYSDLAGEPRPPAGVARAGVRWVSPRIDLLSARQEQIPLSRWLWFAARCETNAAFAWNDPGPLRRRARSAVGGLRRARA